MSLTMHEVWYDSPLGPLHLCANEQGLCRLAFTGDHTSPRHTDIPILQQAIDELIDYFAGKRQRFTLPLSLHGTTFQKSVWRILLTIPYGQTRSYGAIANALGKPGAARAVGMANHCNPVAIIVPCHRVVGSTGALTGYSGGLEKKIYLLRLEGISLTGTTESSL
jgi:methylated-DNA-[protein]-cysteine S-methyltransferase